LPRVIYAQVMEGEQMFSKLLHARAILAVVAGALLTSVIAAPATAAPLVSWRVIHGIVKANDSGHGVLGLPTLWTTMGGNATVDMGSGAIQFSVIGLNLAQGGGIGTIAPLGQVLGTISCLVGANNFSIESTQPVPINPQGDASFSGLLSIPVGCTPTNIAFFITVQNPGFPLQYLAFGSSRFTH